MVCTCVTGAPRVCARALLVPRVCVLVCHWCPACVCSCVTGAPRVCARALLVPCVEASFSPDQPGGENPHAGCDLNPWS